MIESAALKLKATLEANSDLHVELEQLGSSYFLNAKRIVRVPNEVERGLGIFVRFRPHQYFADSWICEITACCLHQDSYKSQWRAFSLLEGSTREPSEEELSEILPAYSETVLFIKGLEPRVYNIVDRMPTILAVRRERIEAAS